MSLVGQVGRKRPRARVALVVLYAVLILGAVTTVYPFLLMMSSGLKGPTDQNDNSLVPAYLTDLASLRAKYVDDKYSDDQSSIDSANAAGPSESPQQVALYRRFVMSLPLDMWQAGFRDAPNQVTGRLTIRYQNWLKTRYRSIDDLNRAYVDENVGFQTVTPPIEMFNRKRWDPPVSRKWSEWLRFKAALPEEYRVPVTRRRMFQVFASSEYKGRFADVPKAVAGAATKFEELQVPASGPLLAKFESTWLPARYARDSADSRWARVSGGKPMPIAADDAQFVQAQAAPLRKEFAGRNYGYVLDYVLLNGRAIWNTALFCILAIMTQLTVNPLAAYALSRYPIRASGQILIFLLATMAFPAEVAMIPSFLLLKQFGLLNTFSALVLPSAASGFMIFLLKGFFDSLPQELFEAGQIDGAKESTMMRKIAFPLSRPVFGYLALLAFMGAYGTFIYAFLVVQDQKMWTLMVWLYQLQLIAPKTVTMAALTLAALPTLVVFLLAQDVIMRGIVLPGEK